MGTNIDTNSPTGDGESSAVPLKQRLRSFAGEFDLHFASYLDPGDEVPKELVNAVRYSALAPGKRIRPFLVVRCCELCGGLRKDAWPVAAAVECVHAFSLIHDDLPAMDDDDLRRGRPTCHKQFTEATAILAGDALLALAFEILGSKVANAENRGLLSLELALATGWSGMIGGQSADISGESESPSESLTKYIHDRKTARLIEAACRMGAIIGRGSPELVERLGLFGRSLGRAFQIADDLLDVTSARESMGKSVGKDAISGKQTYPACVGIEESKTAARECVEAAIGYLEPLGSSAEDLRELSDFVVYRNY